MSDSVGTRLRVDVGGILNWGHDCDVGLQDGCVVADGKDQIISRGRLWRLLSVHGGTGDRGEDVICGVGDNLKMQLWSSCEKWRMRKCRTRRIDRVETQGDREH